MRRAVLRSLLAAALLTSGALPAHAHGYKLGELYVAHPHGRVITDGQGRPTVSVHFAAVRNGEAQAERLVGARFKGQALRLQHRLADGTYADADALDFAAGERVALRVGAPMRLLIDKLEAAPATGDHLPIILVFERAGALEVDVRIELPKESNHAKP